MSNIIKKSNINTQNQQEYKPEKDMGFTYVAVSTLIFIAGMMASLTFASFTYIHFAQVIQLYGAFVITGLLIPKKYIHKLKIIHYERIIIAFTGFPMLLLTLFFVLNYYITIEEYEREYEIHRFYFSKDGKGAYFDIKNPDEYYWNDAAFKIDELRSPKPAKAVLTIGKGVFGFEVEKRLVLE